VALLHDFNAVFDTVGGDIYKRSLSSKERGHNCFHARAAKLRANEPI
jgi:hypothetical protein